MEKLKILSEEELLRIDQASRALLWEVGVACDDERCLEYYEKAGAEIDRENGMVHIPNSLINKTLNMCASYVRLYDRRGGEPLIIGGDDVHFGSVGVASTVCDFETGMHRAVVSKDLEDFMKLGDVLERPEFFIAPASPTEVPSSIVDLVETKIMLENTTKHIIVESQDDVNARKNIEMASVVAGSFEEFKKRPFMSFLVTLTSPLHFRKDNGDVIIEGAKAGIPLIIESGPMAGGTGPVYLAGNLITANAELLNAIVLAKAVNPDVPVVYCSWARILDMRSTMCSHGGPEFGMQRAAIAQLGKYYGLPTGGGAVLGDSKCVDVQLGFEKMGTGILPALAGLNMCFGMGVFADENGIGLETLLADIEITGWIDRVLRGIEVTKETCDLAVFKEVGPGNDFVRTQQTISKYKEEQYIPLMMDRGFMAITTNPEEKNMKKRMHKLYPKLMAKYVGPQLSPEISAKLEEIINR